MSNCVSCEAGVLENSTAIAVELLTENINKTTVYRGAWTSAVIGGFGTAKVAS